MFRRTIEDTVRRFEPRFRSFEVTLLRNSEDLDRTLRFRIRAVLRADADGEPVTYDSRLDPALRAFVVTDVGHE
jgi:type VI secretion system protein ImpF